MRLRDSVAAIFAAATAGAVSTACLAPEALGPVFFIATAYIWPFCLAAGLLFVLPVLVMVPRLRQPPFWVAVLWGGLVSLISFHLLYWKSPTIALRLVGAVPGAVPGAVAGLTYTFMARRFARRDVVRAAEYAGHL
jgi:hypothetical protein